MRELKKHVKTEKDLSNLIRDLVKMTIEAELGGGDELYLARVPRLTKSHNGYSTKRLIGGHGEVEIKIPWDRHASFEHRTMEKGQSHLMLFDDQILVLYAKGMNTR